MGPSGEGQQSVAHPRWIAWSFADLAEYPVRQDRVALRTAESKLHAAEKGSIEGVRRSLLNFTAINKTVLCVRFLKYSRWTVPSIEN